MCIFIKLNRAVVFNTLKRVIGFSELVRKNKSIKGALEKAVEHSAKHACEVLAANSSANSWKDSGGGAVAEILEQLSKLKIQRANLQKNQLGMDNARALYEAIIGDLDETVDYVDHGEPPARVDLQESEFLKSTGGDDTSNDDVDAPEETNSELESLDIVILRYSQTKRWFKEALLEGEGLRAERDDLEQAGFNAKLDSGAKIFVRPNAFQPVVSYLASAGYSLKASSVIVEPFLEEKVRLVIDTARASHSKSERGTSKVVERSEAHIAKYGADSQQHLEELDLSLFVKRTFIQVPIPSSMFSILSARATSV